MKKGYSSKGYGGSASGMKGKGSMGHDKAPKSIDPFAAQRSDLGRMKNQPASNRGYPQQAMDYKY